MPVIRLVRLLFLVVAWFAVVQAAQGEPAGSLKGVVKLESNGTPLHKVRILIVQLGRSTETDETGSYEFQGVPPGIYDVVARTPALSDERRTIQVAAGGTAVADFAMRFSPVREQITVTASGREESTFDAVQSVTTLDSIDLTQKSHTSIGEVLDLQPGVAKRSFGPGNSRPVLRGFDGDRVLVMLDGLSTGSLASQSGDHGENLDATTLEQIEIVRGPATLLYGSNAIGGVVNALTGHHQRHEHPHRGFSGYATGIGGTTNVQGGGSAGLEYGYRNWLLWGGGGGQRTGDYDTPLGEIVNSRTRNGDGRGGFGWYGSKAFFSLGYEYDNRRYGIPFAAFIESGGTAGPDEEVVNLRLQRHDVKLTGGFKDLHSFVTGARVAFGYTHYRHGEFNGDALGTDFKNKLFNYRVTFDQKKARRLSGAFGFSGQHRDYNTIGDEALAPPTILNSFALFALETLDFERVSLQFGGRFEHTGYSPEASFGLPRRSFDGVSGAVGGRFGLWKGGAVVANYTHSYRSPALEELFNNGPHPGNLAFEIGNPDLRREQGNGLDLSLRHQAGRVRAEASFFYYRLGDFVFLTPTGNIEDGLIEAEYLQGDTRYTGGEVTLDVQLHPNVWFTSGMDVVNAELTNSITSPTTATVTPAGAHLPRIPPLRGRLGLDFRYKGLSLRPEGIIAAAQDDIFSTETRTPGYALFNLNASYTIAGQHYVQVFSVNSFNLNDELYRNHLSFIKDLAPEIGRGARFAYTVRFF